MSTCLDNIVAISPKCGTLSYTPLLYLDDLDHVSVDIANAAIDSGNKTGLDLLERKKRLAINDLIADITAMTMPNMSMKSVLENDIVGIVKETMGTSSLTSPIAGGVVISTNYSDYFELYISSVSVLIDSTQTVQIDIYDLSTGNKLDTISISANKDSITSYMLNKSYMSQKGALQLAILMTTSANAYKLEIYKGKKKSCSTCKKHVYGNRYVDVRAVQIDTSGQVIKSNLVSRGDTFGVSVNYSLSCSNEKILCGISNRLATPLLYKWGEYVVRAVNASTRLNDIVQLYTDERAELIEYYHNQYESHLRSVLDGLSMPDDYCFSCNQRVTGRVEIP